MTERVEQCPQCRWSATSQSEEAVFCPRCRFPLHRLMGKYRLERKLAEGGFGVVYRAQANDEPSKVAVKLYHSAIFDVEGMNDFFLREMQRVAPLSQRSPHILKTYNDVGYDSKLGYFVVMELLEGISLEQWLFRQGRTSLVDVLGIFRQLCLAMRAAHSAGVVHRDLKPSNLFLVHQDGQECFVKVIDFGTVKLLSQTEEAQLTQGLMGTPAYMAPEQCIKEDIDARTDIYTMGVLLYEMLTGTPPFQTEPSEFLSLVEAHVTRPVPSMRERKPAYDFPEALDHAVLRALSKFPSERYSSVDAFWDSLVQAVPDLSLEPLPALQSEEPRLSNDRVEPDAAVDAALDAKLAEASESFSLGVARDYGWGKIVLADSGPVLATDGVTGNVPLPSGALLGGTMHEQEPRDDEDGAEQAPVMMPSLIERVEKKPLSGRRRGMFMLVGSIIILALMWLLTELSTPPVPTPTQPSPSQKTVPR